MWNMVEKCANYLKVHWSCNGYETEKGVRLIERREVSFLGSYMEFREK